MDELFKRALFGIAGELQVLACESDITGIYEADLRSVTRRVLQLRRASPVCVEAPVRLDSWPRVGPFDVAVRNQRAEGFEALAELKVWRTADKIDEALWDVWKLASAYTAGKAPNVWLIALGSTLDWRSGNKLADFWEGRTWNSRKLWEENASVMAQWVSPKKGPSTLPAGIKTTHVGTVPVQIFDSEPWLLRCARITTTSGPAFVVPIAAI